MAGINATMNVSDFDSVLDLVHQQASKFFAGMQMGSGMPYSIEDAKTDLDGLSKLTDTLHEKLLSSGVNAIPLDSEMLQLDYHTTIRKGQEEAENGRITMQRVQTNCATLCKAMVMPRK